MLKLQRIEQIKDYVLEHQTVSLDKLVEVFGVSKNTIRRDVQQLVDTGEIKKVYGGVSAKQIRSSHSPLEPFTERKTRNQQQKRQIAELAASYVEDGDIIFIDSGTTTVEMLDFIKEKEVTIITNNLDFINGSFPYENLQVISMGGIFQRKTRSFSSFRNLELFQAFNINKAFMASTGISINHGVTNSSPVESDIKQTVAERSAEVFLLVDHQKFGKYALMTYSKLEDIDYLVTDKKPESNYLHFAEANGIEMLYPE
ncbi:DeoR/GlpR family DNA-binding transcription regulator [Terribacillus sp. 179-K 1B1 HS]|uniref:DeoR/GlpR family DNA-binding transcription regulator n=1 Tax=Terribacillus sp. 179-K 1B1 HS TaxID=3142388 RepID=UPI0039A0C174